MWKGWCDDQKICDTSSAWFKTEDEIRKPCISVNLKHSREQKQTPTGVLNPWTPDYQWISRIAEVTQREILTPGKPRRGTLQIAIKPGLTQCSSNENFTEDLLVTLKCQSPALASLQSSRCAHSTAHFTSPRRWLTHNSYLICPKQNSWFGT